MWNGDVLLSETRNNIHKTYIYEPYSFKPLALLQDGEVYYYHLDHLGTPQEMTDAQGEIVWSMCYKAYGNVVRKDVELVENNLRFQGQYFDTETGLHYNRFRYYDPDAGRFIHQDPIGLLGGDNLYLYVPNPMGWVDPFGLTDKNAGEAEVYLHQLGRNQHVSIKVTKGRMKIHTDQVIVPPIEDRVTQIRLLNGAQQANLMKRTTETYTIPLPDATKAMEHQGTLIKKGKNLGLYDIDKNSCLSHACEVLKAGGVDVPTEGNEKMQEALKKLKKDDC